MYPGWKPLSAFFVALYFQVLSPSDPTHRMAGVDFGEPTLDCAGRGQICRIDQLDGNTGWQPEALGETWLDSNGVFHFSLPVVCWEEIKDSIPDLPAGLFLPFFPEANRMTSPVPVSGRREKGTYFFEMQAKKEK